MRARRGEVTPEDSTRRLGLRQEVEAAGAAVGVKCEAMVRDARRPQWKVLLRGLDFLRHGERCPMVLGIGPGVVVQSGCPEKRSQALRGRNLARDIRVDGAPKVHQAPGGETDRGP
jgi:hypothetical protein